MSTKDAAAFRANLVIAHIWGAVMWMRPGWFPVAAGAASLLIAYAVQRSSGGNTLGAKE